MLKLIDAHAHLHDEAFDQDRALVLSRMKEAGIGAITVGTTLAASRAAVTLAEREDNVWATIGIHPTDSAESFDENAFAELAAHPKVVGIGECGIDYFRGEKSADEHERQRALFERQIELSVRVGKPLMIHGRPSRGTEDAYDDILAALEKRNGGVSGNVHFFVGSEATASRFLALGFTLSFGGVVTFARDYDRVIQGIPPESLLTETDCPYVTPYPFRKERNDPTMLPLIVEALAGLRAENPEEFGHRTAENARRVFGLSSK